MSTETKSQAARRTVDRIAPMVPTGSIWARMRSIATSVWTLGLVAAALTWNVSFAQPIPGLDPSWWAGLYMGVDHGMAFGSQIIFTYGPLGFLGQPWLWFSSLGAIAFVYQSVLHILLCISVVWALRRWLHPVAALVGAFLLLVVAGSLDVAMILTALWCLVTLSQAPPAFARRIVLFGIPVLGATESLIYLHDGPIVLLMGAVTLLADRRWRRDLPIFIGLAAAVFFALWFSAGQSLGNLPGYITNSLQIITGYSQAMALRAPYGWYLPAELLLCIVVVGAAAITSRAGSPRVIAGVVIAIAAFSLFKEAAVRADAGHTLAFFAGATALLAVMVFRRWRLLALGGLVALAAINITVAGQAGVIIEYNPVKHLTAAGHGLNLLFNPSSRTGIVYFDAVKADEHYNLSPRTLQLLKGHTVDVDPWEAAVAWAYGLDWNPLPVLQDYSAYTSRLDRLDADALRSPTGPERILRENPGAGPSYANATIDGRFATWDPPEKSLAMLCNYVPLQTTPSWQVLGKVPDRCGPPRRMASLVTRAGATVRIASPPPGSIVYAKIYGAGVSGFGSIRSFLYRASFRYLAVNGGPTYRLVPGTAADGLLMNAAPGVDLPAPFQLSPGARTIRLTGVSGSLRIDLYSMQVRPR